MICSPERLRIAGRKALEIDVQNSVGPIVGIEDLTDAELFFDDLQRRCGAEAMTPRERIQAALIKPIPEDSQSIHSEVFDPWADIIEGIHGSYSSESDDLMIAAMEAVRDGTTFELIDQRGFAGEFALYVLSGHGFTDYGTSPRGAWVDPTINDLWQPLIDKWKAYAAVAWGDDP